MIEVEPLTPTDHFLRYIDAPGGNTLLGTFLGIDDSYTYVMIYAGACGVVTHIKYLQIYYPEYTSEELPTVKELTFDEFKDAVGSWSFTE